MVPTCEPLAQHPGFLAAAARLAGRIIEGLRTFPADLPVDGQPLIRVAHQVVVNAVSEATPPAGGGSAFQVGWTGAPEWLGAISVEARHAS